MARKSHVQIATEVFGKLGKRVPVKRLENACIKAMPRYLFETKERCSCSSCGRVFSIGKLDKHNSKRRCPKCRKVVTVQRNCGARNIDDHNFIVYAEKIDGYIVARYFYCYRTLSNCKDGMIHEEHSIEEVARQILADHVNIRYEKRWDDWVKVGNGMYSGYWFCESRDTFRWYLNKFCCKICLFDKPSMVLVKENINMYAIAAYEDMLLKHKKNNYDPFGDMSNCDKDEDLYTYLLENAICGNLYDIAEKFISVGLDKMFYDMLRANQVDKFLRHKKNDSIKKIMDMNGNEYRWFLSTDRSDDTYRRFLRFREAGVGLDMIDLACKIDCSYYEYEKLAIDGHVMKKFNYISKQEITVSEYLHYVDMLDKLKVPHDKSNMYPVDFNQADLDLASQIHGDYDDDILKTAYKIKTAMRKSKVVRDMLKSSQGLLVKVPESEEELIREGKKMHNCLGSYGHSVGSGMSLIFFIRRIEEPDKPFYAMEYRNGEIRQLYTYNNKHDERYEEVSIFCEALVKALYSKKRRKKKCQTR